MSVLGDQIDRLEVFLPAIEAGMTVQPRYECKVDPAALPTWVIVPLPARRERRDARSVITIRDFALTLLVSAICDDKPETAHIGREACYPYIDLVVAHFVQNWNLEYDDTGLPGVIDSTVPGDASGQLTSWGGDTFAGVQFRLSITTIEEYS